MRDIRNYLLNNRLHIFITLIMIFAMTFAVTQPISAASDIGHDDIYCEKDGGTYYITGNTDKHSIYVDGKNITIYLQNVTVDLLDEESDGDSEEESALHIEEGSSVTIYLEGNNRLEGGNNHGIGKNYGYAGICVEEGASVKILGNGKLDVKGGGVEYGAAAIGSNYDESCGKITIGGNTDQNCPTINATGGRSGAGIGAGRDGRCDDGIYINNGTIVARGGKSAAGIGGGDSVGTGSGGNTDTIYIAYGNVTAYGGEGAAGIGGSEGGDVKNITITGGTVTAKGGEEAAGIGGGREGFTENLTITGGNITAEGGKYGAGIGGGNAVDTGDGGDIDNLKITGGTIHATGGESGAGIGGGDQSEVKGLRIEEAYPNTLHITATGGDWGAGIGNANVGMVSHNIDSIYIKLNGGDITATGGSQGAGIGGGNATAENIEIYGHGTITAKGIDNSCAIGAGECEDGGDITIKGDGTGGSQRSLEITGYAYTSKDRNHAAVIGGADAGGGDINITDARLSLFGSHETRGTAIGTGNNNQMFVRDMGDITIKNCDVYDQTSSHRNGASIGAGDGAEISNITIEGSVFKGGSIGTADNGNEVFRETCVESITIIDSKIDADNSNGQRAAIGTGAYASIEKITIKNSKVTAKTVCGAGIGSGGYSVDNQWEFLKWTGCECGDILIENSTVTAQGSKGGAGIGGGWGTSVGDVTIKNSKVDAWSKGNGKDNGGAGIGGGYAESNGTVKIENSIVTASGDRSAAGIGCGGDEEISTTVWNTTCHSVSMTDSTVTAKGGWGAAGIGPGYGAQFADDAYINIKNCTVTATGGERGAGIGGGPNGALGSGGEGCTEIKISGTSKVTANGGDGAAGIGGGMDGGMGDVYIDLTETAAADDGQWKYYVKATGGKGAAGIGSGGVVVSDDQMFSAEGHDIDSVHISGGYVSAQGGRDDGHGAGAGIGGGARGGNLNGFYVSGGFVEAHAGSGSKAADDIGSGGDDIRNAEDEDFYITGGTVLGSLSGDPDEIIIDGGSVSHKTSRAERSDGTKVYRTQMQTGQSFKPLKDLQTTVSDYGKRDIISSDNGKVYLYLPKSDIGKATADFTFENEKRHYYGTAYDNGDGWLKMDYEVDVVICDEPVAGGEFQAVAEGPALTGEVVYTVSGSAVLLDDEKQEVKTLTASAGEPVTLMGKTFGEFGLSVTGAETESYWAAEGIYTGTITKMKGTVSFTENVSKIYDGTAVEDPSVETNSNGAVSYTYYKLDEDQNKTKIDTQPKDAGNYIVTARVQGTDHYTEAAAEQEFTIEKRPVTLGMTASQNGTDAGVKVEVLDAVSVDGSIRFFVDEKEYKTVPVKAEGGKYTADITFGEVPADSYKVTAEFINGKNHFCSQKAEETYDKTLAYREITVKDLTAVYGDEARRIEIINKDDGLPYKYEVVSDLLGNTITVDDSGLVTFENAGRAIVEVKLEATATSAEAVAYATVTVNRKDMTVYSYADPAGGTYGKLDTVRYGLSYGTDPAEKITGVPENFAVGTLNAIPLNETSGVGEHDVLIQKNGAAQYHNIFISRNYDIEYEIGTLTVTKADAVLKVNDVSGRYGIEPEYTYTMSGLAEWDSPETAMETLPDINVNGKQTDYNDLEPGDYTLDVVNKDAVQVGSENYKLTFEAGELNIGKAPISLTLECDPKVYDGGPAQVTPTVTTDSKGKPYDGKITYKYYEITENGMRKLWKAPSAAGRYYVKASAAETDLYMGASDQVMFRIEKATPDPETPQLKDMIYREGLTLADQKLPPGWSWCDPYRVLEVEPVSAYAVYRPDDTHNYRSIMRVLHFEVLEEPVPPGDDPNTPGTPDDPDAVKTGDEINFKILYLITGVALITAVAAGTFRRKRTR